MNYADGCLHLLVSASYYIYNYIAVTIMTTKNKNNDIHYTCTLKCQHCKSCEVLC